MAKLNFSPAGGYRRLNAWIMASIVQVANFHFCRRFLTREFDPTGRQFDQMTQAARSGQVNLAEGSARSATSKETEMKLTDVAHASLVELRDDYEKWLLCQESLPWAQSSPEAQDIYHIPLDKPDYGPDFVHDSCAHILAQKAKFERWLSSDDSFVVANAMLILTGRAINMILRLRESQGQKFLESGGFREQLTTERIAARAHGENAPVCPECGKFMAKRIARSGKNQGNPFWGCTGYPDCKATLEFERG